MEFALITACCWAFAGFGSSRIAKYFGANLGNFLRLFLATIVLALILVGLRALYVPAGATLFAAAGALHLGFGDIGLFGSYRRLGPRLALLLVMSLSTPLALVVESVRFGRQISSMELALGAMLMVLVGVAIAPRERKHIPAKELLLGVGGGVVAAIGQGLAAVLNKEAFEVAAEAGDMVPRTLAACIRVGAGAGFVGLWLLLTRLWGHRRPQSPDWHRPPRVGGSPWIWLAIAVFLGPVLGMIALMQAYDSAPTGALVQCVLVTLPVAVIPVAWLFDGDVPSRRSLVAGCFAVLACIFLIGVSKGII